MKKTYLPLGRNILVYGIVFLVAVGLFLFFMLKEGGPTPLQIVLLSILVLIVGYYFISPMLIYKVSIKDNTISINKDFGLFKEDRIQAKTVVELKEVASYRVILSDRNSSGVAYQAKAPKKMFIEFILKSDEKKRIFVSNMSKKQLKSILSNIKEITGIEKSTE